MSDKIKMKGKNNNLKCQCCDNYGATKRRQNTNYVDDEENFKTLCPKCQEENDKYWQERWNDYYSNCM